MHAPKNRLIDVLLSVKFSDNYLLTPKTFHLISLEVTAERWTINLVQSPPFVEINSISRCFFIYYSKGQNKCKPSVKCLNVELFIWNGISINVVDF